MTHAQRRHPWGALPRERQGALPRAQQGARRRGQNVARRGEPAGFTLTELLVVIAIIAVLASLITVAAMSAMDTGKQTAIKAEIDQLDAAVKAFKAKYGMYPPTDLAININATKNTAVGNPVLLSFIMQAFPRYQPFALDPVSGTQQIVRDWTILGLPLAPSATRIPTSFRADQSLVFWLSGFSADPTNPFCGGGPRTPFYSFDNSRLYNLNLTSTGFGAAGYNPPTFSGPPSNYLPGGPNALLPNQTIGNFGYVPPRGNGTPYCYFDAGTGYGTCTFNNTWGFSIRRPFNGSSSLTVGALNNANGIAAGTASPYIQDLTYPLIAGRDPTLSTGAGLYQFCNPTSFQIISAGQDGMFGTPAYHTSPTANYIRIYPTGYGYDSGGAENDNVTNFADKVRLVDAIP